MKNKTKFRQNAIKKLIAKNEIESQQELISLMAQEYDIITNQSIISRDLHVLNASKRTVRKKSIYEINNFDPRQEILHLAVIEIQHNESLIVIHTLPGAATFIADYIDAQSDLSILGTIAGENIILVIPQSIKKIINTVDEIHTLLFVKKEKTTK